MSELFLEFEDQYGETARVRVDRDVFVIGRHSENDLCISNPKLSRKHLEITRNGDSFLAVDAGSSNGTELNGFDLFEPEILVDGDTLNLGGGIKIAVKFDDPKEAYADHADEDASNLDFEDEGESFGSDGPDRGKQVVANPGETADSDNSSFGMVFLIAPLLLILMLAIGAAGVFFLGGDSKTEIAEAADDHEVYPEDDSEEDVKPADEPSPKVDPIEPNPSSAPVDVPINPSSADNTTSSGSETPESKTTPNSEIKKIEIAATSFMQRIARNDPRPVLTKRQLEVVKAKLNQYRGSSGLASNIKSARANAAEISSVAREKNLKPQLVANAAISKLGKSQGDVVTTAKGLVNVLGKLRIQIGDELADECLVTIAAYEQGKADKFLKMRNTMERLAGQHPSVSSRRVRSIWFLKDKGKLSDSEFEFALRFLAVGTITQNPKAFNVNAEALTF